MFKSLKKVMLSILAILLVFTLVACVQESNPQTSQSPGVATDYNHLYTGTAFVSGNEYNLSLKLYEKTVDENTFIFEYSLVSGGAVKSYTGTYGISNTTMSFIYNNGDNVILGNYLESEIKVALHIGDILPNEEFTLTEVIN